MSDAKQIAELIDPDVPPPAEPRIPLFTREITPSNVVLSAEDLNEFSHLLAEANERAKKLELANLDLQQFDSPAQAKTRVEEFMPLEYSYTSKKGDLIQALGVPKTDERDFPEELDKFIISNATFGQRALDVAPLNHVSALFSFTKPSLAIDFLTLPSNPTENRSTIKVVGRDEDWVISTADRINDFLRRKRSFRPAIHASGTYDYLLLLIFIPSLIWLFIEYAESSIIDWSNSHSAVLNMLLAIYVFFIFSTVGRFLFQYIRWLFPPIEYYKKSRVGAHVHRAVAGTIGTAVLLSAIYDVLKSAASSFF